MVLWFHEDVCLKLNAVLTDGNTTQDFTSIDTNNAPENNNCGPTDADNRNKQHLNNIINMREAACVCLCLFAVCVSSSV